MGKKRILITGKNSYIGTSFVKWVSQWQDQYETEEISVRGEEWKDHDFSKYDVVLHVAGIAHVSADPKMKDLYYKVNRDLAIDVAKKAKEEKVKQLIFMSSIIVYGDSGRINERKEISRDTIPQPSNFYGESKLQAEKGLELLRNDDFKIAILRPPMIYGKGSKGNYQKLSKVARIVPFFPDINNKRSILHIDNLCEFIRLIIDNMESGVFFPQNKEYVKTSELVKLIAEVHGKNIKLVNFLNPLIAVLEKRLKILNKVFGNLIYDSEMSTYHFKYTIRNLKDSIILTER